MNDLVSAIMVRNIGVLLNRDTICSLVGSILYSC